MSAISTLGMSPARKRIFEAGYQAEAGSALAEAKRQEAERQAAEERAERERAEGWVLRMKQSAELAAFIAAMPLSDIQMAVGKARTIIRAVADKHGLAPIDLTGPCRSARFVEARFEAIWTIRQHMGMSLTQIARQFGGRDHTSILHAIRTHQARLDAARASEERA